MKHKIKTFSILASITMIVIHIINRVYYSVYSVKSYLNSSDNHYYEWRFGKIRYIKKGSGTPLLLIHDLTPGSSNYEFHKLIEALSKNYEVYALDLIGYGLSEKPNMTYTNYLYVQLLIDFIKNVIGKRTNILATGDAAPIAVMACHNDPEVIGKMIYINPQSLYQLNQIPSKQTKALKLLIDCPIIGTFVYNLLTNRSTLERNFTEEYFHNPINIEEKDILTYLESAHTPNYTSKYAFSSYIGRYVNANIIHALKEINNSIYIIAGEEKKDNHTIIENYEYYNNAIESIFISKTKHLPHLERPEAVLKQIETFLTF